MCSVENMQRGETNTTSVSVYCIFATVTYKTQMRKYTDITDLQCKDCGDRKALKCQELLKHDSIAYSFFMRENNTWLLILTLSFLCFSGVATVSNLFFTTSNSLPSCWYSSCLGIFSPLCLYLGGRTLLAHPSCF